MFIGIPDMRPVMQMRVGWTLKGVDGAVLEQNAYFTPYELTKLNPAAEGFGAVVVDLTPRSPAAASAPTAVTAHEGKRLSELMGCVACHSTDGSVLGKVGPTWKGLFGSKVLLAGGKTVGADEAYLRESIRDPSAKIVRGFEKTDTSMPSYEGVLSPTQIEALLMYIKSL